MAVKSVYSVRDQVADFFYPPFLAVNDRDAMRMVSASLNEQSLLAQNPSDYVLYYIGSYDDNKGLFVPGNPERPTPYLICHLSSLLPSPSES